MTAASTSKTECRVPRLLGYAAIVIAGTVIGATLFGWAIIGLTTVLAH
ncbi:hypothetical protein CCC_02252 [Paramagnetospirillum magnetotacticum MS-1]|uniref:Uncharacterized protein n=1 Tax=Paramagnetospirillum magnetotacticum MS-1 TaxID=272627 RepID=A0A0C2UBD0_PARME|nr:hypothetical protein [Paramagnetospirillum magnetotacticum]KIL98802.1 hypothetical protein CCC_02252 [Paramagnetospirillum magnetotacticum MS-1]